MPLGEKWVDPPSTPAAVLAVLPPRDSAPLQSGGLHLGTGSMRQETLTRLGVGLLTLPITWTHCSLTT